MELCRSFNPLKLTNANAITKRAVNVAKAVKRPLNALAKDQHPSSAEKLEAFMGSPIHTSCVLVLAKIAVNAQERLLRAYRNRCAALRNRLSMAPRSVPVHDAGMGVGHVPAHCHSLRISRVATLEAESHPVYDEIRTNILHKPFVSTWSLFGLHNAAAPRRQEPALRSYTLAPLPKGNGRLLPGSWRIRAGTPGILASLAGGCRWPARRSPKGIPQPPGTD